MNQDQQDWDRGYDRYPQTSRMNALSIAGFVVSMASLFWNPALLLSIVGVVLSAIGRSQATRTGERGRGMALAGILVGLISLIYGIVILVAAARMVNTAMDAYSTW